MHLMIRLIARILCQLWKKTHRLFFETLRNFRGVRVGIKCGLVISIFLFFSTSCQRPQGFTLKKILSFHPNNSKWDVSSLYQDELIQIHHILSQSFTYLGSGNHCYAFESHDKQFVLKFFKQNRMKTPYFHSLFSPFIRQFLFTTKNMQKRKKERETSYTSYKLAYEHLKKETEIVYLHLNKTNHLKQTITLIDQHQKKLFIDIDKMEFLIQKKAQLCFDHLQELFDKKKEDGFEAIASLLKVIASRMKKGFLDQDMQFFKNFGFIGNRAIEIDIGGFRSNPQAPSLKHMQKEMREVSVQIQTWMIDNYPQYEKAATQIIETMIDQMHL